MGEGSVTHITDEELILEHVMNGYVNRGEKIQLQIG